jgi:NitT/TauT family transport system substrate-binding protein
MRIPAVLVFALAWVLLSGACAAPASAPAGGAPRPEPGQAQPAAAASAASAPAAAPGNPYLARPGEALTSVRVATCAVSGGFVHLYTALDNGIFERYGLTVEHVSVGGGVASLAAMSTNEIQFLYCAASSVMDGLATGFDVRLVAQPLIGLPYIFIARPEIRTIMDLKGKSVGVARPGELSDQLYRLVFARHGLVPNEDVQIRPIGGSQSERYRALLTDILQGIIITPPLDAQALKDGMHVIYELDDMNVPFLYSGLFANRAMLRDSPQTVQRIVAALAEALHFTEKNPEAARQSLRRVLSLDDSDALDSAYRAYAVKYINRRMAIPFDTVNAVIEDVRAQGTPVNVRGAEDVATNQFVEDLERTGFLQQLWGAELPPR